MCREVMGGRQRGERIGGCGWAVHVKLTRELEISSKLVHLSVLEFCQ